MPGKLTLQPTYVYLHGYMHWYKIEIYIYIYMYTPIIVQTFSNAGAGKSTLSNCARLYQATTVLYIEDTFFLLF